MPSKDVLNHIKSPEDLKKLSYGELEDLCSEIREKLINIVSKNGGHLASNLGVVELTVALHKVFNTPKDSIVWDVGHQSYAHKMLTDRLAQIDTIRQDGGLSGFPKRSESKYDAFNSGHSSTSISAAYGIARAKMLNNDNSYTLAVIGDGAFTGGLAYEGINNAGRFNKNFIVILNDNEMSISKNVGSVAKYLTSMRIRPSYLNTKESVDKLLMHTPVVGKPLRKALVESKASLRNLVYRNTLFEHLGFIYFGPVDGHNLHEVINALKAVKKIEAPVLVHLVTTKGKGYQFAENNPRAFHGISAFDIDTGEPLTSKPDFSKIFGTELCKIAETNKSVCAITAAMTFGTGLYEFSRKYRERFFDVG
ncbi:MAG: 1-deoxy-D-xylulose-5-phosphate synthase, partial [Bacillota bacterium]|nr:1-deoxy-D-xylulose-5-phosphate synthase [Bacillota bacterium]